MGGCVTYQSNLRENYTFDNIQEKSIVFGEVKFVDFGINFVGSITLMLKQLEDKKYIGINTANTFKEWRQSFENKGEVKFYAELQKGTYQILEIKHGNWELPLNFVQFTVPEAGKIYYLGQLELRALEKPWSLSFSVEYEQNIVNNYDENLTAFRKRLPNINREIIINLMVAQDEKDKAN